MFCRAGRQQGGAAKLWEVAVVAVVVVVVLVVERTKRTGSSKAGKGKEGNLINQAPGLLDTETSSSRMAFRSSGRAAAAAAAMLSSSRSLSP